jgi:hypothetical protein
LSLFTDAAGSAHLGTACFFQGHWFFFTMATPMGLLFSAERSFIFRNGPSSFGTLFVGERFANKKITLFIDNEALVQVINKQTSKSKRLMQLIRFFVLKCMKLDTIFRAVHIYSKCIAIADAISCRQ